jgi:hypothetical protein
MKKLSLILVLLCLACMVDAQGQKTKSYIIVNGGMNYATFYQSSSNVDKLAGVWGPEAELLVRTMTPAWWGYEGGFTYSRKGTKFSDSLGKVTVDYAGLFFDGLLFFPLINNDDAYVGAGFYGAYGLSGTSKSDSVSTDIKFGDTFKPLDIGIELRGGYMIKKTVGFGVHYNIGFTPVYEGVDLRGNTNHGRNSVLSLCISLKLAKIYDRQTTK